MNKFFSIIVTIDKGPKLKVSVDEGGIYSTYIRIQLYSISGLKKFILKSTFLDKKSFLVFQFFNDSVLKICQKFNYEFMNFF